MCYEHINVRPDRWTKENEVLGCQAQADNLRQMYRNLHSPLQKKKNTLKNTGQQKQYDMIQKICIIIINMT